MALQAWVGRTGGQLDADSPLDITLHNSYDDDLIHLRQVGYGDGSGGFMTASDPHTHDNVNSKRVVYTFAEDDSGSIASGNFWTPDNTIYASIWANGVTMFTEVFLNSAWRRAQAADDADAQGVAGLMIIQDDEMRWHNDAGSARTLFFYEVI